MYYPSKKDFIKLAKRGNLIPVYKEIEADLETPVSSFLKIDEGDYSYLLESIEGEENIARFSFLGANPSLVFKSKGRRIEITENKRTKRFVTSRDPLSEIKKIMKQFKFVKVDGLPRFSGGLVGYLGYDMIRFFEEIPDENPDDLKVPDSVFMLTDTLLIFDHLMHKIKIVSNAHISDNARLAYDTAVRKIEKISKMLSKKALKSEKRTKAKKNAKIKSNFTKKGFGRIVEKAKKYIKNGDIIQVVLSQRLSTELGGKDPFNIYRSLRSINPSPYMYYLKFKNMRLIGSSPEIMVRCEDKKIELRPIAGTRPRGKNEAEDIKFQKELLADPKERAEHIMLVDLGRNDIGRVADFTSVNVLELMRIEKYSHVMHIVSDIIGKLSKSKDEFDLIRASFPAGTVTGAPKIRAMEIIDELEPVRRSTYAGCVGYFSFSGNIDTCITIRTILVKDNKAYVQAGAGIVADSKPDKEYQETLNKARALIKAIEEA
ncbi:MAG: anthranilate synthase component I [Candidatus Omnitrophica bacterium]|nr:anthranilate synthase component I [Candidatus Omnitrophota bacterium]MBU4487620.1 anthranilate synthase component I [Candidatus Omnitrophota bacterium]MCG2705047.1 anthranilate synthase component I [Candidatus Omnitrophota bacterium]